MSTGLASGTDVPNARLVQKPPLVRFLRRYPLQVAIFLVAVVIWLIFVIGAPRTFLARDIYVSFMATTPFFAIMAIPLTLVVITGEIDLSFPSIMAVGMTAFELVFQVTHSTWYSFVACMIAGLIVGALNGVIVVRLGVPSLVATIGTQFFWRGAVMVMTGARGMGMTETQGTVLYPLLVGRIGGIIPAQFAWTIGLGLLMWFFLNRHRFGAHVYLVGDNLESARLMGVNVGRTKLLTFAVLGLLAAFAGFLQSEEILFFWPTIGSGLMLNTIAAVFLGGTSVFGGTGTIFGTFVGSFIMGAINAGIVAIGLTNFWNDAVAGFIIVASVALQTQVSKRLT